MDWKERKAEYYEKLKDPRWQQLRLRVFERDEWTCQLCGSKENTLHVHHVRYEEGEPWETGIDLLFTACAGCHEVEHDDHRIALTYFLKLFGEIGIRTSRDLAALMEDQQLCTHFDFELKHGRGSATIEHKCEALAKAIMSFHKAKARDIRVGEWYAEK